MSSDPSLKDHLSDARSALVETLWLLKGQLGNVNEAAASAISKSIDRIVRCCRCMDSVEKLVATPIAEVKADKLRESFEEHFRVFESFAKRNRLSGDFMSGQAYALREDDAGRAIADILKRFNALESHEPEKLKTSRYSMPVFSPPKLDPCKSEVRPASIAAPTRTDKHEFWRPTLDKQKFSNVMVDPTSIPDYYKAEINGLAFQNSVKSK